MRSIIWIGIILLITISYGFSYSINDLNFKLKDNSFTISLNADNNTKIEKNFYQDGVNLILKGVPFDKIYIKKINSPLLSNIKIVPLDRNRSLIKIQFNNKFNKKLFKVNSDGNKITISYNVKPPKIEKTKLEKKVESAVKPKDNSSNKEDKIIEDITKDLLTSQPSIPESKNLPEKNKQNIKMSVDTGNFRERIIKTYSVLAVMCIFLIGLAFLIKKLKSRGNILKDEGVIRIIYRYDIEPKKYIAMIKVYDEYYLVGITEQSITLIDKIDSEELKEEIRLIDGKRETNKFIKYLKKEEENKKDYLISSIEEKIRRYRRKIS